MENSEKKIDLTFLVDFLVSLYLSLLLRRQREFSKMI